MLHCKKKHLVFPPTKKPQINKTPQLETFEMGFTCKQQQMSSDIEEETSKVRVKRQQSENEQESSADLSLINNAWQRAASSVPGNKQPELHQQRRGGFWRGTGGTARWDERDGWCSHLHLSPRSSFFPLCLTLLLGSHSHLHSSHLCVSMCRVTLFILHLHTVHSASCRSCSTNSKGAQDAAYLVKTVSERS